MEGAFAIKKYSMEGAFAIKKYSMESEKLAFVKQYLIAIWLHINTI